MIPGSTSFLTGETLILCCACSSSPSLKMLWQAGSRGLEFYPQSLLWKRAADPTRIECTSVRQRKETSALNLRVGAMHLLHCSVWSVTQSESKLGWAWVGTVTSLQGWPRLGGLIQLTALLYFSFFLPSFLSSLSSWLSSLFSLLLPSSVHLLINSVSQIFLGIVRTKLYAKEHSYLHKSY